MNPEIAFQMIYEIFFPIAAPVAAAFIGFGLLITIIVLVVKAFPYNL